MKRADVMNNVGTESLTAPYQPPRRGDLEGQEYEPLRTLRFFS